MDLTAKKSDYLSKVVQLSEALLEITRDCDEMKLFREDNEFQIGAPNAIVDQDCLGANAHLTAANVDAAVQVAAAIVNTMTLPRRASLRKVNRLPQI
jgi:hypothetical protein